MMWRWLLLCRAMPCASISSSSWSRAFLRYHTQASLCLLPFQETILFCRVREWVLPWLLWECYHQWWSKCGIMRVVRPKSASLCLPLAEMSRWRNPQTSNHFQLLCATHLCSWITWGNRKALIWKRGPEDDIPVWYRKNMPIYSFEALLSLIFQVIQGRPSLTLSSS